MFATVAPPPAAAVEPEAAEDSSSTIKQVQQPRRVPCLRRQKMTRQGGVRRLLFHDTLMRVFDVFVFVLLL